MNCSDKEASTPKTTIAGFASESMGDIWLTVTRVSELTGLNPATIREACSDRSGKYRGGCYVFRKVGKPYEILLSSLPESAQHQYWPEHHQASPATPETALAVGSNFDQATLDHDAYALIHDAHTRKPASIQDEARRRAEILDMYLGLLAAGLKASSALKVLRQRHPDISKPTLWRWQQMVNGHARQYWEPLLAPAYQGRTRNEIPRQAWDFFLKLYLDQAEPSAAVCYRETLKAAAAQLWGQLPSCKTFERRIETDVSENTLILGRNGRTALKESLPHLRRDPTTLKIHELWESDGRKGDVFTSWPDGTVCRPWMVMVREVKTRTPLAIKFYINTNAELVIDTLRFAVERTKTRPKNFLMDHGPEYENNPLAGGQKSALRYNVVVNQPVGILGRMGIKAIWATPYHGAAKPQESFWNVIAENVDKTCGRAYTGRNPVARPEDSDKEHAIPIEQYVERVLIALDDFSKGKLGVHRGHGMAGKSPLELYNELMPTHRARPATPHELNAMRPQSFRRTLSNKRFFELTIPGYGKVFYEPHDDLEAVKRGHAYDLWPDPADPRKPALIYHGACYLGEAACTGFSPFLDENASGEIAARRGRKMKEATAQLKAIRQSANGVQSLISQPSFPELMPPTLIDVLKLPKEAPPEPPPRYITQENGDIVDTETGEITSRVQSASPLLAAADGDAEANAAYLEKLQAEQRRKRGPSWLDELTG